MTHGLPVGTTPPRGISDHVLSVWPMVRIGDHATLHYGKALPEPSRNPGTTPVYGSNGQCGWHDKAIFAAPGIVLGRKGQGPLGVKWATSPFWVIDTAYCATVDSTRFDLKFLYFLTLHVGLNHLKDGTSNPSLSRDRFYSQAFPCPPLPTQRRIASVLSAYDDLIENNTRRIGVLEEMAKLAYGIICGNFNSVAFASGLSSAIPHNWTSSTIGREAAFISRGIAPAYAKSGSVVLNQKCIRDGWVSSSKARTQNKKVPQDRFIRRWDVLICSTGTGTLGRVGVVLDDAPNHTVDTHVSIVRPGSNVADVYWGWLMRSLEPYFSNIGLGSTNQTELARSSIHSTPIALPPRATQDRFSLLAKPFAEQRLCISRQNDSLRAARDLLLPKLLSGELSVDRIPDPAAVAP